MVELLDLPLDILAKILSKSPIKIIHIFRCLSETLRDFTSHNPYFTALHSPNATPNLIIQFGDSKHLKRYVQLIDAEIDTKPATSTTPKLQAWRLFKIPKKLQIEEQYPSYHPNRAGARELNKFALVNACNGLIYFAVKSFERCSLVCNPITNEYIRVPDIDRLRGCTSSLWLGYSPSIRKYKVLRIYTYSSGIIGAHIHDVRASNSWRDVEDSPSDHINWNNSYAFLNGIAYWLCRDFIVAFDFESENFGVVDVPPSLDGLRFRSIGVIKDRLCLTDNKSKVLHIWMMMKSGEWEKKYTCDGSIAKPFHLCNAKLRPLQELSTGEILMVSCDRHLVCYDTNKKSFRSINLDMLKSNFSVVTFVPSFASLEDICSS